MAKLTAAEIPLCRTLDWQKREARRQERHLIAKCICRAVDGLSSLVNRDAGGLVAIWENELPKTLISSFGRDAENEALEEAIQVLSRIRDERKNRDSRPLSNREAA